ncbi:unnamed protein product [Brassicogethes aeneus]|uniref:Uncharacterized protein n=1 Tax=Brassicogethes aeneus TaxID=1431903 RepID=A0A9P0BI12_BRAAE|nr:unnamed protein product [Brassicogethes aeneus]
MEQLRFTHQQIERFNDRIKNCIEDAECRKILEKFLQNPPRPVHLNALKLWKAANDRHAFDEDFFFDLIDEVSGFNENPLLTISECEHKLQYVKQECCRILEPIKSIFIDYLNKHHR